MTADAADARLGEKSLRRLETFLDVVYALVFFNMLQYLPEGEDMAWVGAPLGLLQLLVDHPVEALRIFIGLGLTLIYWNLSNVLLGPLARTDGRHAVLTLLQMACVCLFLYFAISDPSLAGGPSSPALQSVSLTVAGGIGIWGWSYARRHGLVADVFTEERRDALSRRVLIEPVTALLNTPLAFVGPVVWTLGWVAIPGPVAWAVRRRSRKKTAP